VGGLADDLERRAKKGFEDGFHGERLAGRAGFELVEKPETALVDGLEHAPEDGEDEAVLGGEMIIDGAEVGAGLCGNGAQGGGLEAVTGEEALGGIEDGGLGAAVGGCFDA